MHAREVWREFRSIPGVREGGQVVNFDNGNRYLDWLRKGRRRMCERAQRTHPHLYRRRSLTRILKESSLEGGGGVEKRKNEMRVVRALIFYAMPFVLGPDLVVKRGLARIPN